MTGFSWHWKRAVSVHYILRKRFKLLLLHIILNQLWKSFILFKFFEIALENISAMLRLHYLMTGKPLEISFPTYLSGAGLTTELN